MAAARNSWESAMITQPSISISNPGDVGTVRVAAAQARQFGFGNTPISPMQRGPLEQFVPPEPNFLDNVVNVASTPLKLVEALRSNSNGLGNNLAVAIYGVPTVASVGIAYGLARYTSVGGKGSTTAQALRIWFAIYIFSVLALATYQYLNQKKNRESIIERNAGL